MAIPRPVLLALLGVALCAAAFLATRGARDPGGMVTAAPAPTQAAKTPKASERPDKPSPAKPDGRNAAEPKPAPAAKPEPRSTAPAKPAQLGDVQGAGRAVAELGAPKPTVSLVERVRAALDRGDAVVFLFTRPGAADDVGTRQSVQALQGMDRVTVVKAGLRDLARFRPILEGAGVSQVPSVVIAHKDEPAQLIEGFVDRGTLRQSVADALR